MAEKKLNPRERAALEEKKKDQKIRARFILIGAIVVVLAALVIVVNSPLFTNVFPALKVSDGNTTTTYTLADVNYAYQSQYMQIYQTYGSYGLIDTATPLNEQTCLFSAEGGTWDDFFKEAAESNLLERTAMIKAAKEAGYTELTEDEQSQLDSLMEQFDTYAKAYGYQGADSYIALNYGSGNNEKTVRAAMTEEMLGTRYLQDLYNGFTYTDEELDAYYAENADSFNRVNYLYTVFTGTADEAAGVTEEQALAEAEASAKAVAEAADEEAFRTAVLEQAETDAAETSTTVTGFLNQFDGDVTAEELTEGTVFTHNIGTSWYAVYVLGTEDNNYKTVNVRHILVKCVDEDGDGVYSDEEKQAALEAIQTIEEEWKSGTANEESFATLANLKSEDGGSNTNGGLYENISKGQMVTEFNDFCFGGHQSGDTGIVYGESSAYAGYHLIYFVGESDQLQSHALAESDKRSADYNEAYEALVEPYTSQRAFMWRYVMKG